MGSLRVFLRNWQRGHWQEKEPAGEERRWQRGQEPAGETDTGRRGWALEERQKPAGEDRRMKQENRKGREFRRGQEGDRNERKPAGRGKAKAERLEESGRGRGSAKKSAVTGSIAGKKNSLSKKSERKNSPSAKAGKKNTLSAKAGKKDSLFGKAGKQPGGKTAQSGSVRKAEQEKDTKKKKSRCPVSHLCGGCSMIDVPYDEQIRGKWEMLEDLIGDYVLPDPFIRMKAPEHYRHKVTSVFAPDRKGKPVCGIYREGTHEVVPVKSCLIEHIQADRIIQTIYSMLPSFRIHVYDEDMDMGLLRYVQVRAARATKEIMVTLVLTDPVLPSRNTFVRELTKRHPEITTIVINVNDRNTTMVLGNRETVIYGKGYIEDVLCGKRFRISSRAFYQVNPLMTEKLYNIAIDCAALSGKENVLDTYCGIGTIGIIAAPHARRVLGVELNADAVRDAQENIRMNGLDNIEILQGDATEFMVGLAQELAASEEAEKEQLQSPMSTSAQKRERFDVLFMDPPRSGATEEFMRAACAIHPKKIVYISCSPWSLQRDLGFFTENGYEVKKAIPVDMFPYTGGIETVCLLSKLSEAKNHISVKVDMDEMDVTSAESRATYQEIQKWVQEKHGFHVSHLNIAKTKRKCGIIERKNYNLPKNEDSRSPETPKEKEEAITEAFRHFQMI